MAKKTKIPKQRDFHKLLILRGETRGYTTAVPSKKAYRRKPKHPNKGFE